ncbi:MAG TPA: ATP synthase F1 subunit epsilon [Saprospiraceae bacterium]|nr:ATP synthase F1 subunit epsilon [Saprospiraceae bacterium]
MVVYILTPETQLFEGEAKAVIVPGVQGQFEILDRHAPIVSALTKGSVLVTDKQGEKHQFQISQGFVEVLKNEVNVLVRI